MNNCHHVTVNQQLPPGNSQRTTATMEGANEQVNVTVDNCQRAVLPKQLSATEQTTLGQFSEHPSAASCERLSKCCKSDRTADIPWTLPWRWQRRTPVRFPICRPRTKRRRTASRCRGCYKKAYRFLNHGPRGQGLNVWDFGWVPVRVFPETSSWEWRRPCAAQITSLEILTFKRNLKTFHFPKL